MAANTKMGRVPASEVRELLNKKIIDLYTLSYSVRDICEMLAVSPNTVTKVIKNHETKGRLVERKS